MLQGKKKIAFDDVYAAGIAVKILQQKRNNILLSDAASIVLNNARIETNTGEALKKSTSYRSMLKAGLGRLILNICSLTDLYKVTGILQKYEGKGFKNFKEGNNSFKIQTFYPIFL